MKPSDRYLKIVEWSDEDKCYVGTCPGLMLGGVHGDDEAVVYAELCHVVDEWIRIHEEDHAPLPRATAGREYSGKFVVRVGKELHRELTTEAMRVGESLNTYCVETLSRNCRSQQRASQTSPRRQDSPPGGGRSTRHGRVRVSHLPK